MPATEIKRFCAPNGKSRVEIQQFGDGTRFRSQEHIYRTDDDFSFWCPVYISGYYASTEAAEHAAKQTVPWLRDQDSN